MDNINVPCVALSFDDGRKDNYRVVKEILEPYKLPSTFNITSGYVSGDIDKSLYPCKNEPMSIDEVCEIYDNSLFEIAGHGFAHQNSMADWKQGIEDLAQWLGADWKRSGIGIASPHSGVSKEEIEKRSNEMYEFNIQYVRIGLKNQMDLRQRIISKVARETGSTLLFLKPIKSSFQDNYTGRVMYSIPILHQHRLNQMISAINYSIKSKNGCVLQFHSVLRRGEQFYDDMFSVDYELFKEFMLFLNRLRKKGSIKVVKCLDLISINNKFSED